MAERFNTGNSARLHSVYALGAQIMAERRLDVEAAGTPKPSDQASSPLGFLVVRVLYPL